MLRTKLALAALSTVFATFVAQPSLADTPKEMAKADMPAAKNFKVSAELPKDRKWSFTIFAILNDGEKIKVLESKHPKKDGSMMSASKDVPASTDNILNSVKFQVETMDHGGTYVSKLWEGENAEGDTGKETVEFSVPNDAHAFNFKFNEDANASVHKMS